MSHFLRLLCDDDEESWTSRRHSWSPLPPPPSAAVLPLLLLLEVTSALGQTHPHHVAAEHLGWEQSGRHPTLRREITWSAGGISK